MTLNKFPISTVLYNLFEYRKNKELNSFFFENVEKEGIVLYGDFVEITEEDAQTQLKKAREFVEKTEETMQKMLSEPKDE